MKWYRISLSYATFGIGTVEEHYEEGEFSSFSTKRYLVPEMIDKTAFINRWMRNKTLEEVREWVTKKGGTIEELQGEMS